MCIHMTGQTPERQGCSCRQQHGAPCSPSQQFPPSRTDGSIHVLRNCIEQMQLLQAGQQPGSSRCQPPKQGGLFEWGGCPPGALAEITPGAVLAALDLSSGRASAHIN